MFFPFISWLQWIEWVFMFRGKWTWILIEANSFSVWKLWRAMEWYGYIYMSSQTFRYGNLSSSKRENDDADCAFFTRLADALNLLNPIKICSLYFFCFKSSSRIYVRFCVSLSNLEIFSPPKRSLKRVSSHSRAKYAP